ncbi:MAG: FTR1 family protein [Pseudomonadota bacterium]|nr:FTR1 family protein [Pseudomonadota bacterium]
MLASLLLVFREVLEAALIISIVAAATRGVVGRGKYLLGGIALGVLGAFAIAFFAERISELLQGMGQEWFNASVLLAAVVMIGWHVIWMAKHGRELASQMKSVGQAVSAGDRPMTALLIVIALAVLREGAEVVLFGFGLVASGSNLGELALGGVLGLAAGLAVGFAMYFGLLKIPMRHFFSATNGLLVLLAAGLAASAAGYLIQADVLPALVDTLWDTSWLLSDKSFLGQVLHILVGYEDQPSGMQVLFYAGTVLLLVIGMNVVHTGPPKPVKALA